MAYDQTKYLLKTAGLDLDGFYEDKGLEAFVSPIGSILRPSLLLGGATLAYCTSSDPLVLLVAANQPGFSSGSDLLSDGIYYLTTILSFARAYASPSAYTLPLVALQGTNLVSHLLVDTGLVAEDNYLMQWMQLATGLASETLGLFLYPDLPIKALQGISVFAQGLHCAELAGEDISSYFPYSTHTNIEATTEASSTEATAIEDLVTFN